MKPLRKDAITVGDLTDYADQESDFAFEMKILKLVSGRTDVCSHGGAYVDRVTKKTRQFDMRAIVRGKHDQVPFPYEFRLALECKCIGENFPLLVQCIPRMHHESFHDVIASLVGKDEVVRITSVNSVYTTSDPTGKNLIQVGRDSLGNFVATDSDVYEKWAQALASANDLFELGRGTLPRFSIVMPIVVVPDKRLWQVCYDENGVRKDGPKQVDNVSYYVGEEYQWTRAGMSEVTRVSHLEFVTETGIKQLFNKITNNKTVPWYFNQSHLDNFRT